jgi:UDP-N-acetyl-D-mannosaminuronate dehydrogenase
MDKKIIICVVGLGYVGLPLARLFSKRYRTIGYDNNPSRIKELESAGEDGFIFTDRTDDIKECNFYIVAVPTPVDTNNRPDLDALIQASEAIGTVISKDDIVVYESTVYPGVTEEECIPRIEEVSGMKLNTDFYAGYSPERINPGDHLHSVENIMKVTSGSTAEAADLIDNVYQSVLKKGTFKVSSIKVAEQVIKTMNKKGLMVKDAKILLLGFSFKENCPDIRNTKVADIYTTLSEYTKGITIYDPICDKNEVEQTYKIKIQNQGPESLTGLFDAVVLCVAHDAFKSLGIRNFLNSKNGVVYDVKGFLDKKDIDGRL